MANLKSIMALLFLLGVATSAAADYYVWVDENGVTNYSQRNPKGYDARYVSDGTPFGGIEDAMDRRRPGRQPEQPGQADQPEASAPTRETETPGQQVDPDQLAAEEREKLQEKISRVKKENCQLGKRNLAQLQAYSRIRVEGEGGEQRFLTEEERQAKIDEARQIIRENCNG